MNRAKQQMLVGAYQNLLKQQQEAKEPKYPFPEMKGRLNLVNMLPPTSPEDYPEPAPPYTPTGQQDLTLGEGDHPVG